MADKSFKRKSTLFHSTINQAVQQPNHSHNVPFSFLKRFVTKLHDQPEHQRKFAAQCTQVYKNHPDYVVTDKEISELLPNMNVVPNNKALEVFGISYNKTVEQKKYFSLTPLVFVYAMLLNTCNDVDFDEKIKFAFNMSDDDQDGLLSREDVWKLLSYQNEENGIGLQDAILDEMVDAVFEELDHDKGGTIDLEEFTKFFSGFKSKNIAISASNKRIASFNSYSEANRHNSNTGICYYLRQRLSIEGTKYFWTLVYLVGFALVAWYYFTTYYQGFIARGFAKMFAGLISYHLMLILLIINKSFITFLRVIPFLPRFFPVNKNIVFHKHMTVVMLVCAIGHVCSHLFGTFIVFSTTKINVLNTILYSPMQQTPSYPKLLFGTVPGLTGIFLVIGFVLMAILARKPVRTTRYELFWYSHHLYIVMLILLHIHGMKEYVAAQTYWRWIFAPALLLVVEKVFKFFKMIAYRYEILKLRVSSGVIELELKRPRNFMYTAGQYAVLNIPQISTTQWHPFTISSCPIDETINFYISPAGWWTKQLAQMAKDYESGKIRALPRVRIDGPWGAPSQHYEDFKHLMIIGSGIGATPFCSILKEILGRLKNDDEKLKFREIDFIWVNRKPQNTRWLNKVLLDLRKESNGEHGRHLNLYIYYTGAYEKYDFRSFMLWNGFEFMKEKGRLTSDKMANFDCMHWGRPDWDGIFSNVAYRFQGKKVGVFMCANKILCTEIYGMCRKYSGQAKFHFYKENFG